VECKRHLIICGNTTLTRAGSLKAYNCSDAFRGARQGGDFQLLLDVRCFKTRADILSTEGIAKSALFL